MKAGIYAGFFIKRTLSKNVIKVEIGRIYK